MKKFLLTYLLFVIACAFSSCSVVMAAKKEGTSISNIQHCKNRNQFLSNGGTILSSERLQDGTLVEVYQFKKERGSMGRAFMHGLLDVSTFGLWEVIGTPMEGMCNAEEFFCIKVHFDKDDNILNVSLN